MNLLKVIYFHIYNAYYKDGNYKNDIPHLTAFSITSTSIGCLTLTLIALLNYGLKGTSLPAEICFIVFLVCFVLFFVLFLYNERYKEVYNSAKGSKSDATWVKILVWVVVILGFASVGLYSYIFNNNN